MTSRGPVLNPAFVIEQHLGDPDDPDNVFSFKRAVELDEKDEYPEQACDLVVRVKVMEYLIPAACGGQLRSHEDLLDIVRILARRDLTVAVAHGQTYLAALTVWISGTPAQQRLMAEVVSAGRQAALALTEEQHGSDILANEVSAKRVPGGYRLSGKKWLINNGTRGRISIVHARTNPSAPGPRAYTLFMVDKQQLDPDSLVRVSRKRTLGIRGADISGVGFDDCFVPDSAVVGKVGHALEITLRTLQVSRTLCAGFSLGAADTAIRTALDFSGTRRLYGQPMFAIRDVRRTFVDSFLRLIICEHVSVAGTRGLHTNPEQTCLWSSVVKYFVPVTVECIVRDMAVVLGARAYLREHHAAGVFQKLARDQLVVALFDGSTIVNLHSISYQLEGALNRKRNVAETSEVRRQRLQRLFCLKHPVPDFRGEALELYCRGLEDVVQGVEATLEALRQAQAANGGDSIALRILELTQQLQQEIEVFAFDFETLSASVPEQALLKSSEILTMARRYCTLFAASANLHTWFYNRNDSTTFLASGEWLVLALSLLLGSSPSENLEFMDRCRDRIVEELLRLHRDRELFSSRPFALAHHMRGAEHQA